MSDHLDVGADAEFFKGRLGLAADWYVKNTDGLPCITDWYMLETTSVRNTGVEVDLLWKDRVGDFAYSISGNLSTLNNEVTSIPYDIQAFTTYGMDQVVTGYGKGHPMWALYGYPSGTFDGW